MNTAKLFALVFCFLACIQGTFSDANTCRCFYRGITGEAGGFKQETAMIFAYHSANARDKRSPPILDDCAGGCECPIEKCTQTATKCNARAPGEGQRFYRATCVIFYNTEPQACVTPEPPMPTNEF